MKTGDKIKIFPDTDRIAYMLLIRDMGFESHIHGNYIIVDEKLPPRIKTIGERIKKMRNAMYFKRAEMAEELGIPESEYIEWEECKRLPKGQPFKTFCEIANCTQRYVMEGQGTWNPDSDSLLDNGWWTNQN